MQLGIHTHQQKSGGHRSQLNESDDCGSESSLWLVMNNCRCTELLHMIIVVTEKEKQVFVIIKHDKQE